MRLPILLLSLLFCLPLYAQHYEELDLNQNGFNNYEKRKKRKRRKRKDKLEDKYFQVQGAYFYETDNEESYDGFGLYNLSITGRKNNIQKSFELEYVGFSTATKFSFINSSGREVVTGGEVRQRRSLEFIYGHSFLLSKNIPHGFFVGPTASLLLDFDQRDPIVSSSFAIKDQCFCLGLGFKAGYDWSVSKKITINLSTRLTLIDVGIERQKVENPSIPLNLRSASSFTARLLRKQFPLMIGVRFKI